MVYLTGSAKRWGVSTNVIAGCKGSPAKSFNHFNSRLLYNYGLKGG